MKTLLKNGNLITMENDEIRYFTDLMIEDGRIAQIERGLSAEGAEVIDCSGKYLLPGLMDAHIHISTSDMCGTLLACGVTAVRHLSGGERVQQVAREIETGQRTGPVIYSSGYVYDSTGGPSDNPGHKYIATMEEAEQAVYDTIEQGYLWVKTYPSIPPDLYRRLMDTANACGIKVCGHMSYHVDAKELRDWGYHCCEHSSSMPRHPADNAYLAKSGMWYCPTHVVCETLPDYVWNGKKLSDLQYLHALPAEIFAHWESENIKIAEGYKNRGLRPDINAIIDRGRAFMEHSDRYMAGSDAAYPGVIPGFSLHEELSKLVELYGCTPYEALRAATSNPARYMNVQSIRGLLSAGLNADILILRENPMKDIRNTLCIDAVIQAGRVLNRAALDALINASGSMTDVEHFENII